jgi:hypothetical protein
MSDTSPRSSVYLLIRKSRLKAKTGPGGKDDAPMSSEELAEAREKAKKTIATMCASVHPPMPEVFGKTMSDYLDNCGELVTHFNDVFETMKVTMQVVTDDPDMRTGAYFDPTANVIKLAADTDPVTLVDNLVWESCNAANGDEFRAQNKAFSGFKMGVEDYGDARAKTEFKTSLMYASLIKDLQQSKAPLAKGAIGQLEEIEGKAPGFFEATPEERQAMLPSLEQSFCELPHDAAAASTSDSSLSSSDMYKYQKVAGLKIGGACGLVRSLIQRFNGQNLDRFDKTITNFASWVRAGYTDSKAQAPAHFLQALDAAGTTFGGTIVAEGGFAPRMREVATAAAGPAMPAYDPTVSYQ